MTHLEEDDYSELFSDIFSYLLTRRQEIVNVIADHPYCTVDFLHRRFVNINTKTLHYDLGQLIKKGLVQKSGTTRGATYLKNGRAFVYLVR